MGGFYVSTLPRFTLLSFITTVTDFNFYGGVHVVDQLLGQFGNNNKLIVPLICCSTINILFPFFLFINLIIINIFFYFRNTLGSQPLQFQGLELTVTERVAITGSRVHLDINSSHSVLFGQLFVTARL